MFASQAPPKTIQLPDGRGTVTIRKLSAKQLRAAADALAQRARHLTAAQRTQIPEAVRELGGRDAVDAQWDADPVRYYDPAVLLMRSVLAWDPPRTAPPGDGTPLQLWLAREILDYSKPQAEEGSRR
jgi:hypothetical protein